MQQTVFSDHNTRLKCFVNTDKQLYISLEKINSEGLNCEGFHDIVLYYSDVESLIKDLSQYLKELKQPF